MFLFNEIYSIDDTNYHYYHKNEENNIKLSSNKNPKNFKEIMEDRNIYTKKRYKNIFELRNIKLKWMIEDLPNKVKNFVFIKYEDLITNFVKTLMKIRNCGIKVKNNIDFPLNTNKYKKENNNYIRNNKKKEIDDVFINRFTNKFYEDKFNKLS